LTFFLFSLFAYVLFVVILIVNGLESVVRIWILKKPRGIDFPKLACGFVASTALNSLYWQWSDGIIPPSEPSFALSLSYAVRALSLAYLLRVINLRRKGKI